MMLNWLNVNNPIILHKKRKTFLLQLIGFIAILTVGMYAQNCVCVYIVSEEENNIFIRLLPKVSNCIVNRYVL